MRTDTKKAGGRKRLLTLYTVLCCNLAAIGCSAGSIWYCRQLSEQQEPVPETVSSEYVIYVGLNDKDTQTQLHSTQEAAAIIDKICEKYVDGYSYSEMKGGWKESSGEYVNETTLAYQFMDTDADKICRIMDEVIHQLNQVCILIDQHESSYYYYYGSDYGKNARAGS